MPAEGTALARRTVRRRTQLAVVLAALALMLGVQQFLLPWGMAWVQAAGEACAAISRLRWVLAPLLLLPLGVAYLALVDGLRSLQYGVWPWPGMWLWKDTPLRGQRYARWRGWLLLGVALPLLLALGGYMLWLLVAGDLVAPHVHARCVAQAG